MSYTLVSHLGTYVWLPTQWGPIDIISDVTRTFCFPSYTSSQPCTSKDGTAAVMSCVAGLGFLCWRGALRSLNYLHSSTFSDRVITGNSLAQDSGQSNSSQDETSVLSLAPLTTCVQWLLVSKVLLPKRAICPHQSETKLQFLAR